MGVVSTRNQVSPISMLSWISAAEGVLDEGDRIGEHPPYSYRAPGRYCGALCTGVCCFPCVTWSALWRLVACPFQCILNGPGAMCSNNPLTSLSDRLVEAQCHQVYSRRKFPALAFKSLSSEERDRFLRVVDRVDALIKAAIKDGTMRLAYELCDAYVEPLCTVSVTPVHAAVVLDRLRHLAAASAPEPHPAV